MSRIGSIQIKWEQDGEITWNLDFPYKDPEQLYSLGGVALTDHLLATLISDIAISFCETVLRGLVNNDIEVKPIGAELKSANLELHRGRVLYTIFKAKSKLFYDNQKLEQAISQMAQNYIGKLLATASKTNNDAIKFGIFGVVASCEQHIRVMHETNQSVLNTRTNIAKAIEVFINRYPYGIRPEDLEKHMGDVENLIGMLNVLPRKQNQSLLHL
jgi:hypothetical protein